MVYYYLGSSRALMRARGCSGGRVCVRKGNHVGLFSRTIIFGIAPRRCQSTSPRTPASPHLCHVSVGDGEARRGNRHGRLHVPLHQLPAAIASPRVQLPKPGQGEAAVGATGDAGHAGVVQRLEHLGATHKGMGCTGVEAGTGVVAGLQARMCNVNVNVFSLGRYTQPCAPTPAGHNMLGQYAGGTSVAALSQSRRGSAMSHPPTFRTSHSSASDTPRYPLPQENTRPATGRAHKSGPTHEHSCACV
jgi:hypothetical protein